MTPIFSLYAAILTLIFIMLSVRVSLARNATKISVGDGGNDFLLRRIRAQANFAEYIPLALLLLLGSELSGMSAWWLHGIGIAFIVGRLLLAYGMEYHSLYGRIAGMVSTYTLMIGLSFYLLASWWG